MIGIGGILVLSRLIVVGIDKIRSWNEQALATTQNTVWKLRPPQLNVALVVSKDMRNERFNELADIGHC